MKMPWLCRCSRTFFLGVVTIQITNSSLLYDARPYKCVCVCVGLELSAQSHRYVVHSACGGACLNVCACFSFSTPKIWTFVGFLCRMNATWLLAPRVRLHPSSKRLQPDFHAFQLHSVRFASIRLCVWVCACWYRLIPSTQTRRPYRSLRTIAV